MNGGKKNINSHAFAIKRKSKRHKKNRQSDQSHGIEKKNFAFTQKVIFKNP